MALIVRNSYPGVHSSQIGFPGGKVEEFDADLEETALRETHEEVGIHPEKIQIIKPFSEIYIPPSNFLVAPFMGISHEELTFIPDSAKTTKPKVASACSAPKIHKALFTPVFSIQ